MVRLFLSLFPWRQLKPVINVRENSELHVVTAIKRNSAVHSSVWLERLWAKQWTVVIVPKALMSTLFCVFSSAWNVWSCAGNLNIVRVQGVCLMWSSQCALGLPLARMIRSVTPEPGQSSELELILRNRVPFEKLIVAVRDKIFFLYFMK
jgi:hypothetical protein